MISVRIFHLGKKQIQWIFNRYRLFQLMGYNGEHCCSPFKLNNSSILRELILYVMIQS